MKKKSVIAITSVFLNLVLLSALVHYDKINNRALNVSAPFFTIQHLSSIGYLQSDSHAIALASTVK
jgi:hypothetical protein